MPSLSLCLIVVVALASPAIAQGTRSASLVNRNPDFEAGLGEAWWPRGESVKLGTRLTPSSTGTYFGNNYNDWNMVVITGLGSIEQWIPIDGRTTKFHIVSMEQQPFRIATGEDSEVVIAAYGLDYFDANFNHLRCVERPILKFFPGFPVPITFTGDRVNTVKMATVGQGAVVPENAKWVKMWVENKSPNHALGLDAFYLLQYSEANSLVPNIPTQETIVSGNRLKLSPYAFFQATGDYPAFSYSDSGYFNGFYYSPEFGPINGIAYQPLRVEPGKSYRMVLEASIQASPASSFGTWFGFDYYKSDGSKIREDLKYFAPTAGAQETVNFDFAVPTNASNTTFWIVGKGGVRVHQMSMSLR